MAEATFDLPEDEPSGEPPASFSEAAGLETPEPETPEPEAEEAAEPEAKAEEPEPKDEPEEGEEPRRSRGASERIRQEVERRKELETKMERMEERFQQLLERSQQPQQQPQPETPIPSLDDDPAGNFDARLKRAEETQAQYQERLKQEEQHRQYYQQVQQIDTKYQEDVSRFKEEHPDYMDAMTFLQQSRMEEWQALGLSPLQAEQQLREEALQRTAFLQSNGRSAAEHFYDLARRRGYKHTPQRNEATEIERLAENTKRASSVGSRGATPKKLTLADLADLDDESFMKATEGKNWQRLHEAG